jgi:ring-1,2-phenylacetyl-CoA epoxidase subunit PaaE
MALPTLHQLTIAEVRAEAADAMSVRFAIPASLLEAFAFTAGQFLTLEAAVGGEVLRRSYSICSSPSEYRSSATLRVGIRRVVGGRFSNWAHDHLRAGSEVAVLTPDGRFGIELTATTRRHYLGIAGGSGITPMLSLIKTALECEPESRFTLVYGNRTVSSIMFLEEIEGLKNRWMERLSIFHVLSEEATDIELLTGLLDRARIARLCDKAIHVPGIDCAFVCGPAPMMEAAEDALVHAGLDRGRIRIERFGSPDAPAAAHVSARANAPRASASDAPGARVTVIIDGKARPINVPFEGASILDTAMAAGIGLPYACKAGVCCTCRARVLEGEVTMDKQYSLERHELDAGFVLSCQSHPVTPEVRLSFDER